MMPEHRHLSNELPVITAAFRRHKPVELSRRVLGRLVTADSISNAVGCQRRCRILDRKQQAYLYVNRRQLNV